MTPAPQRSPRDRFSDFDPIELWLVDCADLAESLLRIEVLTRLLPPDERERAARIVDPEDAVCWRNSSRFSDFLQ